MGIAQRCIIKFVQMAVEWMKLRSVRGEGRNQAPDDTSVCKFKGCRSGCSSDWMLVWMFVNKRAHLTLIGPVIGVWKGYVRLVGTRASCWTPLPWIFAFFLPTNSTSMRRRKTRASRAQARHIEGSGGPPTLRLWLLPFPYKNYTAQEQTFGVSYDLRWSCSREYLSPKETYGSRPLEDAKVARHFASGFRKWF